MVLTFVAARSQRDKPGSWKPGQSGNPKGAPRRSEPASLQELCRANTEEAVKTLIVAMRFKGPQQVPAAIAILDRGWGKPVQPTQREESSVHLHLVAAQLVEAVNAVPREPTEPQRQTLTIEGDVPTE